MKRYLARRVMGLVPVLFIISILVFGLVRVLPGDPARLLAAADDTGQVDPEVLKAIREKYGLDRPVVAQYLDWIGDVLRGDWGTSFFSKQEVFPQMVGRLSFTAQLAGLAWFTSLLIGVPLGVISALKRNSAQDVAATSFAVSGIALPSFWFGLLMIIVFSVWLHWLPAGGYVSPQENVALWAKGMLMPTMTLALALSAITMRQTRSGMLEVLREDFIRTARAKGMGERRVIWVHAMRNALLPVITITSLQLGGLMGGTVVTETVFFLPGMGRFIVDAVLAKDFLVIQMGLLLLTVGVLTANLVADLAYMYVDPRIRYQ
jgi:peptide/nickel transport system permease protein